MQNKLLSSSSKNKITDLKRLDNLYKRVSDHINAAHQNLQRSINTEMIKTYFLIGKEIVEEEQQGKERAEYGKAILNHLSIKLKTTYKSGFGVDTLEQARKFYLIYGINSKIANSDAVSRKSEDCHFNFNLSWTHYRELIKIKNSDARLFYEIESAKNNWSARELKRQIGSLLYERIAKSKDKKKLLELTNKGHEINTPEDVIKDPFVLEFVGLPESHRLVESKLEEALINNLQHFLLELGKGFAFIARQKRLTLESDHFYVDLVFYHAVLKCYILLDIKTHSLTHADLGQMQLYVNYFDAEIKANDDNPTIGLVLCTDKNDAMVKYTLGDKAKRIFASKYQFHLPTEAELEAEIKREIKLLTK